MIVESESPAPSLLPGRMLPQAPYRGIESFRFIDEPIFCARSAETLKLVRSVTVYRGVLLYGASGSGKSSLINAGLMPELVREGFFVERIRVQPIRDEEMIIERISLTPEGLPPYLSSIFVDESSESSTKKSFFEKIFSSQGEADARLVLSVDRFLAALREGSRDRPTLLIFDQFEEFVTLFEEAPQVQSLQDAREIQAGILEALVTLLRDHSLPVKLLFAFREDYLARLSMLFRKCPDLTDQYLRLTSPDRAALLDIVRGPFRTEEARTHFGRELSDEVAGALSAEMDKRGEGDLLNLSEVEIVCDRLWHSDNPAELLKSRGIQGLLEDYLAEELDRLQNLRDPAVALLSRMVTSGGTRNVISEDDLLPRVSKEEKLPLKSLTEALRILEKDTRLVRREQRNKVYFYEIVSEFLVPWIFRQKELREAARDRGAFRRRLIVVSALIFLVGAGVWAWQVKTLRETALYQELAALQETSREERRGFETTNEAKDREILGKQERLDQAAESEKGLLQQISQFRKDLAEMTAREKVAQERIAGLGTTLQQKEQQIVHLDENLKAQLAETALVRQQAEGLQQSLQGEQTETARLGQHVVQLRLNLEAEQAESAGLRQRVGQLQQSLQTEQAVSGGLRQQVDQLQDTVRTRQTEYTSLRQITDQLRSDFTETSQAALDRLTRIEQLRRELNRAEGAAATCLTAFEQAKTELETCRAQSSQPTSPPP